MTLAVQSRGNLPSSEGSGSGGWNQLIVCLLCRDAGHPGGVGERDLHRGAKQVRLRHSRPEPHSDSFMGFESCDPSPANRPKILSSGLQQILWGLRISWKQTQKWLTIWKHFWGQNLRTSRYELEKTNFWKADILNLITKTENVKKKSKLWIKLENLNNKLYIWKIIFNIFFKFTSVFQWFIFFSNLQRLVFTFSKKRFFIYHVLFSNVHSVFSFTLSWSWFDP